MDESLFLHNLCQSILKIDNSIEFAAIIDFTGKLIIGKFNHRSLKHAIDPRRIHLTKSHSLISISFYDLLMNTLYFESNKKNSLSFQTNMMDMNMPFQLLEIGENLFIAFVSLNEQSEKYLYVYIKSNKYLHKTIMKLNKMIT